MTKSDAAGVNSDVSTGLIGIRLLASNGEYVVADPTSGEPVARYSPGREWDTWHVHAADPPEEGVHLATPEGGFWADVGSNGVVMVGTAVAMQPSAFQILPFAEVADEGRETHGAKARHGHPHGETPDDSVVVIRAPNGRYVGIEVGSDRLVARAERATWDVAFSLERVTEEPLSADLVGQCVVTPKKLAVTGVHAIALPTGNVLYLSYVSKDFENDVKRGRAQLWNPDGGPVAGSLVATRNLFCSSHCRLGDGRILFVGGQSNNWPNPGTPGPGQWGADHDVHTLGANGIGWTRRSDMPGARYYPTAVTLADGNAFIASGAAVRGIGSNVPNDDYEIFDRRTNTTGSVHRFRPPGDFLAHGEYPFLHLLPDGSNSGLLFVFAKNEARLFDIQKGAFRAKSFKPVSRGARTYPHQGASVLLPLRVDAPERVRVLVLGGQEGQSEESTASAEIFEFIPGEPDSSRWRSPSGGAMRARRFMSDAVLLPDETVLVVNGAGRGAADRSYDPVYEAEVFDTRDETWIRGARINRPRLYHSTAVLLPDGRVAIAGNTETFNPGNPVEDRTVELYSPAYLFRGARPTITAAPGVVPLGQDFRIKTPNAEAIERVALLRAGSVTHTFNTDQRHLILPIRRREAGALVVGAPPDGTIAPPGEYMLFLLNHQRVPSKGRFVRLREPTSEAAFITVSVLTAVKARKRFTATVTMRNTGSLTWTRAGKYGLGSQAAEDNMIWGLNRVGVPADVVPGDTTAFTFQATAPEQPGVYPFQWRMLQESVAWFGPTTPAMRIAVTAPNEPAECEAIRTQLEQIREQIAQLQGELTGNPKTDAIILRQIRALKTKADALIKRGNDLGCVIAAVLHH